MYISNPPWPTAEKNKEEEKEKKKKKKEKKNIPNEPKNQAKYKESLNYTIIIIELITSLSETEN